MITKTNLDVKLNQLEEKLEKRIDLKVAHLSQKINFEMARIKERLMGLEEKKEENKDLSESQDKMDSELTSELDVLRARIGKLEEGLLQNVEKKKNGNSEDVIEPDEI